MTRAELEQAIRGVLQRCMLDSGLFLADNATLDILALIDQHTAVPPCCASEHWPRDTACRTFTAGGNGRCVYCDHEEKCHPGPGATCEIGSGEGPESAPDRALVDALERLRERVREQVRGRRAIPAVEADTLHAVAEWIDAEQVRARRAIAERGDKGGGR